MTVHLLGDIGLNGVFCDPLQHRRLRENLEQVAERIGDCDLRIGNFESPLWGDGGVNELKLPRLATTEEAAECLIPLGLDVAVLSNNHVYDCLDAGFRNTCAFLEKHGIRHVGAGWTEEDARKPLIIERRDWRIGLLSYVGPETHPNIPDDASVHLNFLEPERVVADIEAICSEVDLIVVNLHWGAQEFVRFPTALQRCVARRFVEAGAHVIAGHHSHCVMGHEAYQHGHIFYGLGNFIFGDFGGRPGQTWPTLSRRIAIARVVVDGQKRITGNLLYYLQRNLLLEPDDTRSRRRSQARLDGVLVGNDAILERAFRGDVRREAMLTAPMRFLRNAGGPRGVLARLRLRHLEQFVRAGWGR